MAQLGACMSGAGGRPTDYTPEIAEEICFRIGEGETLLSICREENKPVRSTIYLWLREHKEFSDKYAQAREVQADTFADEAIEIADDAAFDWQERIEKGKASVVCDYEHIQRSRVRIDTRKWLTSVSNPKKYSERIKQEISGPDGGPVEGKFISDHELTPAEFEEWLKSRDPGVA